jgi:MFS family permease
MALIGTFAAIYHPVATAMVMGLDDRPGHALAVNGVWGNMGIAAATLATALLAGLGDWRVAFVVPGVAMLLLGLFYAAIPAQVQTGAAMERPKDPPGSGSQLRVLAFLALSGLLGGLIFNGVTIALPKFLDERLPGSDLLAVGTLAAAIFAVAGFAQLPVGRLLDRWGARPLLFAIEGTKTPFLLAMAIAPGWLGAATALPVMLLVFGEIPITAWLLGRYLDERWWSRAYAVQYLLALGVAVATVPLITALHRATGDQVALLVVLSACSLTILAATFLVPRTRRAGPCQAGVPTSALGR